MNTLPDNSSELIVRSRNGDLTAFQQLVEQYQGYAFTLAFRMLGDEDEANDTVQETFIRVWKHIAKFNFSSKFTTWLFRIVTNLCLDRIKSGKRKNNVISSDYEPDDLLETADSYHHNPEDDYIQKVGGAHSPRSPLRDIFRRTYRRAGVSLFYLMIAKKIVFFAHFLKVLVKRPRRNDRDSRRRIISKTTHRIRFTGFAAGKQVPAKISTGEIPGTGRNLHRRRPRF